MDCCYLGSRRAFRETLLTWDKRVVKKIVECVETVLVACSFRSVDDNFECTFAGVYAPMTRKCYGMNWLG